MDNIMSNAVLVLSSIWDMCVNLYTDLISFSFKIGDTTYGFTTIFTSAFLFVLVTILIVNWVWPN